MAEAAPLLAERLSELDPPHASQYKTNAKAFSNRMNTRVQEWKKRISQTGIKRVVTYHKTLDYFIESMGLELLTVLEPKPGISPSVNHLSEVMNVMKAKNTNLILIENFFNPDIAKKLRELNSSIQVAVVPVSIEGESRIKTLDDLYENLVSTIENLSRGGKK
jgi:zinc/manganese transport system substrate-binding protein